MQKVSKIDQREHPRRPPRIQKQTEHRSARNCAFFCRQHAVSSCAAVFVAQCQLAGRVTGRDKRGIAIAFCHIYVHFTSHHTLQY